MVRSAISVNVAILVLLPVLGVAQQENPNVSDAETPKARPSPEALAVREGVTSALDRAVTFSKSIPTPPSGTWGINSEGTGGGGIFRDSDSDAEAWLGSNATGVTGYGSTSGGFFQSSISSGFARLGFGDLGIAAFGNYTGAYFEDADGTGYAWLAYDDAGGGTAMAGEYGVYAGGGRAGGFFEDTDGNAYAYLGWDTAGIVAYGTHKGGRFADIDGSGEADVGMGDVGVQGFGESAGGIFHGDYVGQRIARVGYTRPSGQTDAGGVENAGKYGIYAAGLKAGGYFEDRYLATTGFSWAYVAHDERGIESFGSEAGGYFKDTNSSAYAYVAYDTEGIAAYGSETGGYFKDSNSSGTGYVGRGHLGIWAFGDNAGGWFENTAGPGRARVAYYRPEGMTDNGGDANHGEYGVYAEGETAGGYFEDADNSGYAYVALADIGIAGRGDNAGAYFQDNDSAGYAWVGSGNHKILGSGAVSFVQNHPYDSRSVIIYAAPEGDEVATYTRGTGRLVNGEATLPLGETFKWVTNPDIGLTAHLTPRGEPIPLAVVELSTDSMTVRGGAGAPDGLLFDYVVYGLRIGFEETSVVQEKEMEAYIPSMASHRQLYQRRPDLRRFNSLERFKTMRNAAGEKKALDLRRAHALRDAIIEFDPMVHELPRMPGVEEPPRERDRGGAERLRQVGEDRGGATTARSVGDRRRDPGRFNPADTVPVDDEGNVYANSFRSSSGDLASLVEVSETVEPGDVLVIDRGSVGMMRRGFEGHDNGVIGVVAANAGVVLGSHLPSKDESGASPVPRAEVAMAGVVSCKVDAAYGAIWTGDLLVTSATPGHAMRTDSPLPGTIVGKALEPLEDGTGLIKVLVMLR